MSEMKTVLGPMRVPFLILTPACVLLGYATAVWTTGNVNVFYFIFALIGGVSAHISVNSFNEYFDFKTKLDEKTERTPFSGGSGTLQAKPEAARTALITSWTSFAVTALIGVYFTVVRGWGLLPLGLAGLIIIYAYTAYFVYQPILCLLAPGLGFGPLMVMGTYYVCAGSYSYSAFIASLVPFFLVSNLLLLNQFPDVEADKSTGRKHFPILIGKRKSSYIYGLFHLLTYATIIIGVYFNFLPALSLIGLATLLLTVPSFIGALKFADNIKKLVPSMGMNVLSNILTPVLVSVGLFIN